MTTVAKYWIIFNPTAGKGKAVKQFSFINDFFSKQGCAFEIILTKGTGDAIEIVRNLDLRENDAVVAAGGDGTCNEVVNGLLTRTNSRGTPLLGILPLGRGNDFSFTPGITGGITRALEILVAGKIRILDAGCVTGGFFPNGRYFINGVGIGFDTKVGFDAAKMKHVQSGIAYALGAIINIARYDPSPVIQIRYDDKEMTMPLVIVSLMNGRRMGGSFYMGPNALLDDGLLDICAMRRPAGRLRLIRIVSRYLSGMQEECTEAFTGRAAQFHLTAVEGGMAAHCDGETICYDGTELDIRCVPAALRLIGA